MLEYRLPGASCRPAQPSARAWGRSSTPAVTPFCPKRSRGGRCSRRRPRFPRDPRRTTRCRVRGLRLRNPGFRSGHRTIWIAVAVWLNAGLLAATALAARLVPDRHDDLPTRFGPNVRRWGTGGSQTHPWRRFELSVPPRWRTQLARRFTRYRRGMTTVDTSAADPEIRWHGPFGRVSLR